LQAWEGHHQEAYDTFLAYKTRVPVRGAILLNLSMDKCILVKGWKASAGWSFPRGKINKGEMDVACAVREVFEETGFDAGGLVEEEYYVDVNIRGQSLRLYIIPNVPEDSIFDPQTRKEISKVAWFELAKLPAYKKGALQPKASTEKFYHVAPFLGPLRRWIKDQQGKVEADVTETYIVLSRGSLTRSLKELLRVHPSKPRPLLGPMPEFEAPDIQTYPQQQENGIQEEVSAANLLSILSNGDLMAKGDEPVHKANGDGITSTPTPHAASLQSIIHTKPKPTLVNGQAKDTGAAPRVRAERNAVDRRGSEHHTSLLATLQGGPSRATPPLQPALSPSPPQASMSENLYVKQLGDFKRTSKSRNVSEQEKRPMDKPAKPMRILKREVPAPKPVAEEPEPVADAAPPPPLQSRQPSANVPKTINSARSQSLLDIFNSSTRSRTATPTAIEPNSSTRSRTPTPTAIEPKQQSLLDLFHTDSRPKVREEVPAKTGVSVDDLFSSARAKASPVKSNQQALLGILRGERT